MTGLQDGGASDAPPAGDLPAEPAAEPVVEPASAPALETAAPAAPAAAGKPADPAPADPDRWPRSAGEWSKFKATRDEQYKKRDGRIAELEKALAEREAKLASFSAAVDPKEHSIVREERDKLSEALRLAAVEKHPRFVAYYDGKVAAQVELAKRVVGPERAEAVATLLKQPENPWRAQQLEELLSELSPMSGSRLGGILNTIDALQEERATEIDKARADYDSALARQQAEGTAAQQQQRTQAEQLFDRMAAEAGLPMLQARAATEPDSTAWNAAVQQRLQQAKALLFGQEKPESLVKAALSAVSFPVAVEHIRALATELEQTKAELAGLRKATPTVQRATSPPARSPNGEPGQPSRTGLGNRPMSVAQDWMGLLNQPAQE